MYVNIIIIIIYEKSQLNGLVWGSLTLVQVSMISCTILGFHPVVLTVHLRLLPDSTINKDKNFALCGLHIRSRTTLELLPLPL